MKDTMKIIKAQKLLNDVDSIAEHFNFEKTNKIVGSIDFLEQFHDIDLSKNFVIFDIISMKFKIKTIGHLEITNFNTYSEKDCKKIVSILNERIELVDFEIESVQFS